MLLFSGVSSRRRLWALNKQQLMECRCWIIHWHRLTLKAKTVSASKLSQERPEENGLRRTAFLSLGRWQVSSGKQWNCFHYKISKWWRNYFWDYFLFKNFKNCSSKQTSNTSHKMSRLRLLPLSSDLSHAPSTCTGFASLCKCCSLSQRWFNVWSIIQHLQFS